MIVSSVILVPLLAALALVDLSTRRLPDWLTIPLIPAGLAVNVWLGHSELATDILGAGLGFLAFWTVARLYRSLRGQDGLGLGDAKLLAAAGAWLGPFYLAPVVLLSAILAIACALALRLSGRELSFQSTLPFGPFLSVAFAVFWFLKVNGWSLF